MPTIPTFYEWLQEQHAGADTPEGDLAADAAKDPGFPRDAGEYQPILDHLTLSHACRPAIEVFKDGWCAYIGTVDRIRYGSPIGSSRD